MRILISTISFFCFIGVFAQFEQIGYATSMAAGRSSGGTTESIITAGGLVSASKEYGGDYFQFNGFLAAHAVVFTIAPRTTPLIDFALESKTYGDEDFTLSATSNSASTISYSGNNDDVASVDDGSVTINGAGDVTFSASQVENEFYFENTFDLEFSVGKANLDVTAADESITYGEIEPSYSYSYSGFVNDESEEVLDTEPSGVVASTTVTDAGTYSLQVSEDGDDNNYEFNYIDGILTVDKAELTVTADNQTISYGDNEPSYSYSYSGFVNSETAEVLDSEPSSVSASSSVGDAGTYSLEVEEDGSDNNYSFSYQPGTLTVQKVNLSVLADDITIEVGDNLPGPTLSYTGFVNNEDETELEEAPTAIIDVSNTNNPGTYDIVVSGGVDNNYSFSLTNGTLTIEAIESALGLTDQQIQVFPNPAIESFQIGNFKGETQDQLILLTMEGKETKRFYYKKNSKFDISDLSNGTYLLMVISQEKIVFTGQIIKH